MIDTLNLIINDGLKKGLLHNFTEDSELNGSEITIHNQQLTNFGSCSYLGLEYHPELKQGAINAITKYGTQFSTSRTYLSIGLYNQLEIELEQMFKKPVIVTASTTLGHLSALPIVIGENDAVILDLQVHSSVQLSTQILKTKKIATYIIPHNCMESLEAKIKSLQNKHQKIWYLADGVYSMYGDTAPLQQIEHLLNTYKQFHLYIDDAHGMGWIGKNGIGYVRSQIQHHDKMVMATSLNKSFAAAGGLLIFPNEEMKSDVKNCGSTLIFSGPIQPPMLGAAIASAKLHQTVAFKKIQESLRYKIDFVNNKLASLNLPQYKTANTPLFFIPVGLPKITSNIIKRMKRKGFYLNAAAFPAVPMKKGGIRFMVTENHSLEEIETMLETLQQEYALGVQEEESSLQEIAKIFRISPFNIEIKEQLETSKRSSALTTEIYHTIKDLDQSEWDYFFYQKGNLLYDNLLQLEQIFSGNTEKENNWSFFYFVVRDVSKQIVLISCFTSALVMDDMLSPENISKKVKLKRTNNPYFLTSQTIISGCLFTKGESVVINYKHDNWKEALALLIHEMQQTAEKESASRILIREFNSEQNDSLKDFMLEQGMVSTKLLNNCVIDSLNWKSHEEYLATLGQKYRYNLKKEVLKYEDHFSVNTDKTITERELDYCYNLYQNVYDKALAIAVFQLPKSVFKMMLKDKNYDIIRLYLKGSQKQPVAVMFSHINHGVYNAMIVGLDYKYVREHNTYKQILYQTVKRAKELGCDKLDLAYTAEMEKKKVGAQTYDVYAYTLATEHLSFALLDNL